MTLSARSLWQSWNFHNTFGSLQITPATTVKQTDVY